jgi:hypothetical protein
MSEDSNNNASCGCGGCVMFVIFIFMIAALGWGVPIGASKWNIDLFPPRIWDMNDPAQKPAREEVKEKVEEFNKSSETNLKTEK